MRSLRPSRGTVVLLTVMFLGGAFAGCFGGDDTVDPTDPGPGVGGTDPSATPSPTSGGGEKEEDEDPDVQVPEAHYHHHWGDPPVDSVFVFDGAVTLDAESCRNPQSRDRHPCIPTDPTNPTMHVGSVAFTPEDDGWDIDEGSSEVHKEGRVDTVFSGTKELIATFEWEEELVGNELFFYHRPANSPQYLPRPDQDPVRITKEDNVHRIEVGPGMADPAHQFWVSRWAFMLVANGGPTDDWMLPLRYSEGDVTVTIEAINGGKQSIDPPHPDHWKGKDRLTFGKTDGRFDMVSVHVETDEATYGEVRGSGYEDVELPPKSNVPAGTDRLTVRAWVNVTDDAYAHIDWGLKYRGANTLQYTILEEYETGDAGERIYDIYVTEAEVDPPYERQSYFRFGFYPILQEQSQNGVLDAEYTLHFEATKKDDFRYLM